MLLYDSNDLFQTNLELDCNLIEESWGSYIKVKNFWKYPHKIREIALNIPCFKLPGSCYNIHNGTKYFDGRSQFVFPNQPEFSNIVFYIILKYFNIDKSFLELKWKSPTLLFNNVFKMIDKNYNMYQSHSYAPHRDGINQIACTWYMNENYGDGEGTAFYDISISETDDCLMNNLSSPWANQPKKIGEIPAEYNSLVIYSGDIPHGQMVTERWFDEERLTMVQFYNDHRIYK